jgi:hypothetical protein
MVMGDLHVLILEGMAMGGIGFFCAGLAFWAWPETLLFGDTTFLLH